MYNLENEKLNGVHYSRYIASWRNRGGRWFDEEFQDWLRSLGATEDEVRNISEMACCGKMELEVSAIKFIEKEKKSDKEYQKLKNKKLLFSIRPKRLKR